MNAPVADIWPDFARFATEQVESGDIDPAYPVLRECFSHGVSPDVAVWRLILYLAYYHIGSAEAAWREHPEPSREAARSLPVLATGVERRGMRGNKIRLARFASSALEVASGQGGLAAWVDHMVAPGGEAGWRQTRATMALVREVGPWATYKWADLVKHVLGKSITADDIGVGGGGKTAGPVAGLSMLTGRPLGECATDKGLQRAAYARAVALGIPFNGLDQFETALCDFNSLVRGRYYVGHDLDMQMTQIAPGSEMWACRFASFPQRYLGELCGWHGVRKALKTEYRDRGRTLWN